MSQNKDSNDSRLIRISIALFILLLVVFNSFHRIYSKGTGLDALSTYFYGKAEWASVIHFLRDEEFLNYKAICAYHVYIVLDFLFIVLYAFLLYRLSLQFKKKCLKWFTFSLTGVLIAFDVFENVSWWQEENTPMLSGIKMLLVFALLLITLNHFVGKYVKNVKAVLYTLWYCRLSLVTLILMSALILNPQGKDLLVFMFEHEKAFLFLILFNFVSIIAGVVCWYAPRFLYPENPQKGSKYKVWRYTDWNNHFDLSSYRTDSGEQQTILEARVEQMAEQKSLPDVSAPAIRESMTRESKEFSRRLRMYIPIGISLAFYAMLTAYFFSMWSDLPNNTRTNTIVSLSVSILVACLIGSFFTSPSFWNKMIEALTRAIKGRWVDYLVVSLFLVSLFCFAIADQYKDTVTWWELFGQGLMLITQGLFILSIAHLRPGGAWMRRSAKVLRKLNFKIRNKNQSPGESDSLVDQDQKDFLATKQRLHVTILLSLLLVAVLYLVYLSFLTLWVPLGLSVGLVASLFYYCVYLAVSYKGPDEGRKTHYLSTLLGLLVIAFIVATRIDNNHLDVDLIESKDEEVRVDLWAYTREFKESFRDLSTKDCIPVYFIAANGGGNLQAYWTARVIGELRASTGDTIRDHIFAMSGASGGSVGLGLITQSWGVPHSDINTVVKSIYSHDYFSGGASLLLGSDLWLSIVPCDLSNVLNRNQWLYCRYEDKLDDYFMHSRWSQPFTKVWSNDERQTKHIPLYFANSTMAESGERAVCGPVSLQQMNSTGFDILSNLDTNTLSFGQAVLLSERFPYVNTSGKVGELGHFVDGGYHDNAGLETLMEVYRTVKDSLFSDGRFQPRFIHINFGTEVWKRSVDNLAEKKAVHAIRDMSEFVLPPLTAYNSILAEPVMNRVEQLKNQYNFTVYQCYLPGSEVYLDGGLVTLSDTWKNCFEDVHLKLILVPLARTISNNQQRYVDCVLRLADIQPMLDMKAIVEEVRLAHK